MPWHPIQDFALEAIATAEGTHYVLFFASGSPPWCGDCREAQPILEEVFGAGQEELLVIRVGTQEERKAVDSKWKVSEFKVSEIPMVVKIVDGVEVGRLGEQDCKSSTKLKELLRAGE